MFISFRKGSFYLEVYLELPLIMRCIKSIIVGLFMVLQVRVTCWIQHMVWVMQAWKTPVKLFVVCNFHTRGLDTTFSWSISLNLLLFPCDLNRRRGHSCCSVPSLEWRCPGSPLNVIITGALFKSLQSACFTQSPLMWPTLTSKKDEPGHNVATEWPSVYHDCGYREISLKAAQDGEV